MSSSNNTDNVHIEPTVITRPEIRCHSVLKKITCKYVWVILDFKSACTNEEENKTTWTSQPFSVTNETDKWYFELRPGPGPICPPDLEDRLFLSLEASFDTDDGAVGTRSGLKSFELKCALINSDNEESECFRLETKQKLHPDEDSYHIGSIINLNDLFENEDRLLPQNKLTINFEITFYEQENLNAIDDHQESSNITPEVMEPNLEYFGKLFNNEQFSDIKIHVNGKEYPAHKNILAGRSPVFAAMLKHNLVGLVGNQMNRIDVEGVEDDVFLETLRFIYTGKVQNLETLAFKLLPVADRYELKKLKIMCGDVLSKKLSVGTAVNFLLLADRCNEENLKKRAINFIRAHSVEVISKVDSRAWTDLMSQPVLGKEVVLSCLK